LKIGQHLPKLLTNIKWLIFFLRHSIVSPKRSTFTESTSVGYMLLAAAFADSNLKALQIE